MYGTQKLFESKVTSLAELRSVGTKPVSYQIENPVSFEAACLRGHAMNLAAVCKYFTIFCKMLRKHFLEGCFVFSCRHWR